MIKNDEEIKEKENNILGIEPVSNDQFSQDNTKSNYSILPKPSQSINFLLKALQDFSNRYDMDSRHTLSGKKFLLTFKEIISLIKDVLNSLNKIFEFDYLEKDKIQDIIFDYINNLSYNIFSFEKMDINNEHKKKKKYTNIIRDKNEEYFKKFNKTQQRFNISTSNIISINNNADISNKTLNKYFSSNYIGDKENHNQRILVTKNENENKVKNKDMLEIKGYNYNYKSLWSNRKTGVHNKSPRNLKMPQNTKRKGSYNKSEDHKVIINKKEEKTNTNNNKRIINAKVNKNNNKANNNLKTATNNKKIDINNFNTFNNLIDYTLKNNSVVLRNTSKNKALKTNGNKINKIEAYNYCSTLNDIEQQLMDCQYIKDGYVVKGKINIYNNVPKPSLLANKLLEKSKKFISDYNGFNEEEKRRKSMSHNKIKK